MKKIILSAVLSLACLLAYSQSPENNVTPEMVDLGLSVKWASFNIDASAPGETGGFYSWGEVETKSDYRYRTYKWAKGSDHTFTKYCPDADYGFEGFVDGKTELDPEDDVASVKWGNGWRMPSGAELSELRRSCKWEYVKVDGICGYRVTGKNGNSIFLPLGGTMSSSQPMEGPNWPNSGATYYTRTLTKGNPMACQGIYLYSGACSLNPLRRAGGRMVRAVHE